MNLKTIRKPDPFDVAVWGLMVAFCVGVIYYFQLRSMQDSIDLAAKTMQIDQRAWLYPNIPNFFPLDGPKIPATIQVSNIGKTVATHIVGHVIGTTFNKGDSPALDHYGIGHAHTNIYAGAIYPAQPPIPVPLVIVKYSDKAGEKPTEIAPTPELVRQIQQKEVFILLFGEIHYCDVFGVQFCNGSGDALSLDGIKECIYYNRADNENTPTPSCQYAIPPS